MDGLSVPAHGFKLIAGPGNPDLCAEIARTLDVPFCKTTVNRFADGEIFVRIDENVRGNDVFIVQPTNPPADNILELLLLIDAARRASAARITCVMPYYGYSRQDRKDQPRVAIGAKLLANMIVTAGANRHPGLVLSVLPRVPVVRHHARDARCRRPARRVDQEQELHDVVGRRIRRLHDEDVVHSDVLINADENLAVGKAGDRCLAERHIQRSRDLCAQIRVSGPC